jgi:hypothetical protein
MTRSTAQSRRSVLKTIGILLIGAAAATAGEWQPLFDGTSLTGWKASEKPGVFTIIDANTLKVEGGRSHLFWMGTDTIPATFTDFEFSARVKTTSGSNSGIFFHTEYQESGWPKHGYEAQVNSTHKDKRKTASIYAVQDVMNDAPSTDGEWFDYLIRVKGKTVTISVDGKVVNEYTEPADLNPEKRFKDRRLSNGTFAIQGHDPKSITYYRNIKVRTLK